MSNWPFNTADLSHPNFTARTSDRRKDIDWDLLEMRNDHIPLSAWIGAAVFLFVFFVVIPAVAVAVGFF